MDWAKVTAKLLAASDQHAKIVQNELLRGGDQKKYEEQRVLSQIFYGLHAAFEAGLSHQPISFKTKKLA